MNEADLDPEDWPEARRACHAALDHCLDWLEGIRDEPVWRETPPALKARLATALPHAPQPLGELVEEVRGFFPYATGNLHPRFFGWVHGAGTVAGGIGDMMAGFLNCNLAGRDHVAVYVERQIVAWCKAMFGLPESASGILTGGTSMGTVIALAAARKAKEGSAQPLVAYASREAHGAIAKAWALLGFAPDTLRLVPADGDFRLPPARVAAAIAADRAHGFAPAILVATAGTVNTGALDDLAALGALARAQGLWFHVDAAFGGLAVLAPELQHLVAGIERADSIAFDFHKWLQVPYDCGCVLVRDADAHRAAFSARREYLASSKRGLAGGDPWYCEFGPEMSRGFRALKVWFTVKAYGSARLGEVIARNCRQAQYLARLVAAEPELELLAPVSLNIVCFRYRAQGFAEPAQDALNEDVVADLQVAGIAAPSTTRIAGRLAIRVCLVNHRTREADLALTVRETLRMGRARAALATPLRRAG